MKCLQSGMKREAVQEERSRGKGGGGGVESSNNTTGNGNANKEGSINSNGIKVEDVPESTCTYR